MTEDDMKAHEAFEEYRAAKLRAEATLDIMDAVEAGKAWRAFLNTFLEPERQMTVDTNVIRFPRRRLG